MNKQGDNIEKFFTDEDGGLVFEKNAGVLNQDPVITPPSSEMKLKFGTERYIPYGEDNKFPSEIFEKASKSTIIPSTLKKLASFIYGGGLVFGKVVTDKSGNEKFVDIEDEKLKEEIRTVLRKGNADGYIQQAALSYVWYNMIFPELKLSKDGSKILAAFCHQPRKVRWQVPNTQGEITKAYLYADWDSNIKISSIKKETKELPVINQRVFDPAAQLKELVQKDKSKKRSYIYRLDFGEGEYYNTPEWYSSILSEWLDFSLQIPKFKNAMMKNQMAIKYIVYVDTRYWETKFGKDKWDKKTPEEKSAAKKAELTTFLKNMKGTDGAGGAVISQKIFDPVSKQEIKLWEVEAIDDKLKDGTWIVDSTEASSHILYSIGIDPSITGAGTGKNFGTGSGSDKRVATNILISSLRHIQDLILKPFDLMRDYNGWDWNIVFRMRNSIQLTLDQGSSAKESK